MSRPPKRAGIVPAMIGAIQTHGQLLHWHPHMHVLITCGAWTPEGEFLELPALDMERLLVACQDAVFELYLAEEKIEPANRREHAELAAQWLQCRSVGVPASRRSSGYRASDPVQDTLPIQFVTVGDPVDSSLDRLRDWVYGGEDFLKQVLAMAAGDDLLRNRRCFRRATQVDVQSIISATASSYQVDPEEYVGFRSGAAGRD